MKIIIIGAKGTAVNIAEQIYDARKNYNQDIEVLGFAFDDDAFGPEVNGYPIVCKTSELDDYEEYKDIKFIFSIYKLGLMRQRAELVQSYGIRREKFHTFIHPTAYVANSCGIGYGNVIMSGSVVHSNVRIGDHNIINATVNIGHDSRIGDNNFITPQTVIGSNVAIGNCVFIGMHSTVAGNVKVEDDVIVGMASNVLKDIPSNQLWLGNPAKFIKNV